MKRSLSILITALVATFMAMPSLASEHLLTSDEEALLQPSEQIKGVKTYDAPGFDVADYPKVLIGSITVYYSDDSKTKSIDPDQLKQISDKIRAGLVQNLSRHVEIVDEPGKGVALINTAIVEVKLANKKRGLFGYTPLGFVATSAANAANARLALADAKIQVETVDSVSGKVLSLMEVYKIENLDKKKQMSWEDIRKTVKDYMRRVIDAHYTQ